MTKPLLTSTSPPPDEELNPFERAAEAVLRTGSNLLHGSIESKRMLMLILALLMSNAAPAVAGPFEDALAAYQKGDHATALRLWQPLADQGDDPHAQYQLGLLYENGWGVPQDDVQAHMRFDLSAAQGDRDAAIKRSYVAAKMTPAQMGEAQKMAREWRLK